MENDVLHYIIQLLLQLNMSLFTCQDGTAAVAAKQSKKAKKDVPVSQYPAEVN